MLCTSSLKKISRIEEFARDNDLVNLLAGKAEAVFRVRRISWLIALTTAFSQFALKLPVIGDAVHHVAAAETLRVFE